MHTLALKIILYIITKNEVGKIDEPTGIVCSKKILLDAKQICLLFKCFVGHIINLILRVKITTIKFYKLMKPYPPFIQNIV